MTRLAGVFSTRPAARERAARAFPDATVVTARGFSAAWAPGEDVDSARRGDVLCVVAGSVSASALAQAYAEDRLELRPLRGAFTVLLWDERRRRGLVAADQLGVLSPVYRRAGEELAVALEARDLLRLLERRPDPDERSLVRWLVTGSIAATATLFAGVERLPGGHLLEVSEGATTRRRYWRLQYREPLQAPRAELEDTLRAAVGRAVESRLREAGASGVLLSGGLDSAVVAATAVGAGPGMASYSLVFPEHAEVDERERIERVAAELGLETNLVPFRGGELLPAAETFVREWKLPPASPTLAIQLPLLRTAAADGVTTLLDGQGGDELFGAPLYLLADCLRRGRLREARVLARRISDVPDRLRPRVARRALRVFGLKGALPYRAHVLARRVRGSGGRWAPPWLTPAAAESYRESSDPWRWKQTPGPRWWSSLADAVTEQRERAGAHEYLRRRNAVAGVTGGHPLLQDLDLIELALRLPPDLAFDPTVDRALLRSAIPAVPDVVRRRTTKSYFTPVLVDAIDAHDAETVRRLLTARDAAVRAYARPELVREHLLDVPADRRGNDRAWALWRLATLEYWLRSV